MNPGWNSPEPDAGTRVRIPADVDRPDTVLAGLTARQLAILAIAAVAIWAGYVTARAVLPLAVFAALAAPLALAAGALALGRRDGLSADRWVLAALRHLRSPRRLVPAAGPVPPPPAWTGAHPPVPVPAPLRLPAVGAGGLVDLGGDGAALICRASAVTFALRTPAEQAGLVAGFARWLNSLAGPTQIVVRAEPVDLTAEITALQEAAGGLPHPALEAAAREHAAFLAGLSAEGALSRQVLVVLRDPVPAGAGERLARRASEAAAALAGAGVSVTVLDPADAAGVLARAADPDGETRASGLCAPGETVTGRLP